MPVYCEVRMPETPVLSEKDVAAAKRQYVELYGSVAVMNTYLKIAVLTLCAVALTLAALDVKTYNAFHHLQPLVIRINQVGRAEAINYGSLDYQPQEAELKYFLVQFVTAFYGRMRATIREAYPRALYFLDARLADAVMESTKKSKVIEAFLVSHTDEIDINVVNVAIEDLRSAPYKATVEFEKIVYSAATHEEIRRERFVAHVVFIVKQPVPNALIPINPLGLAITYLRDDQAFQEQKQ
jgi:type IV secretory pathway TrbF-like protein